MVARLASMAFRYQKVAGSSPAVVIFGQDQAAIYVTCLVPAGKTTHQINLNFSFSTLYEHKAK